MSMSNMGLQHMMTVVRLAASGGSVSRTSSTASGERDRIATGNPTVGLITPVPMPEGGEDEKSVINIR